MTMYFKDFLSDQIAMLSMHNLTIQPNIFTQVVTSIILNVYKISKDFSLAIGKT